MSSGLCKITLHFNLILIINFLSITGYYFQFNRNILYDKERTKDEVCIRRIFHIRHISHITLYISTLFHIFMNEGKAYIR